MSMDKREADLPPDSNLYHSFNATTTSSSSSSPPDFLRNVQAAFKRHRMMPQLNNIQPRRLVVRRETSKSSDPIGNSKTTAESEDVLLSQRVQDSLARTKNVMNVTAVNHGDASITPPSMLGTTNGEGKFSSIDAQSGQPSVDTGCRGNNMVASSYLECDYVPLVDDAKKVQFALANNSTSQELESNVSNQLDVSTALSQDGKHQNFQNIEADHCLKTNGEISPLLTKRTTGVQYQTDPFRNFLQSDFGHHMTQSSAVGSSYATTTLVNSANAPMPSSPTHCSRSQHNNFHAGEDFHSNNQPMAPDNMKNPSNFSPNYTSKQSSAQTRNGTLVSFAAAVGTHIEKRHEILKDDHDKEAGYCGKTKKPSPLVDKSTKRDTYGGDITDIQSQAPMLNDQISDVKTESSKSEKKEKAVANKHPSAHRKKINDSDIFFTVNEKKYQRLGKIGSGGSSEVHKVITHDCKIHALKKIKLKGRDYATAYGFCQEIEYLNKLKGKDHIIQLIDYEVTDKALLKEVMSGSVSNKDGRLKDDGYIFMVLEYGEIDLAHMLSHKWKELNNSTMTMDENWLRFYWQQMLLAVKTIHEERIVHSDLKPPNFLLVRGSLKLIDFGIAKAIMSDTTNIQRDSQVGTLSYMSPEAFMCNERDADGNTIKCGRPSDIWSLGCILYQMVYGRTPFADYKTFWHKFKVVTDPNHEIRYDPVPNPCLLDLMKRCLAWDRNQRWKIPQLLQHPFLVPPIPPPLQQHQPSKLIRLLADSCKRDPEALVLCARLQRLLADPLPDAAEEESISADQRRLLVCEMTKLCVQLKEQLE